MTSRTAFAYVVSINGPRITLNIQDVHRGHFVSHRDGTSVVTEVGSLFGVDDGYRLQVMRVRSLFFAEPREAHRVGTGSTSGSEPALRNLEAIVVGALERNEHGSLVFIANSLLSPALGAAAYPLTRDELGKILEVSTPSGASVCLGTDIRSGGKLRVDLMDLLGRHVAVLGSTGHGKSCLTAAALQQMLLHYPRARIVVFDINGEYEEALRRYVPEPSEAKFTKLGESEEDRIPYVALGRHGLSRLLLPSERTQRPALNFAIEKLGFIEWFPNEAGVGLEGAQKAVLFDDCRPFPDPQAKTTIQALRSCSARSAKMWPNMRALGCLVAEGYSLQQGRNGLERSTFQYSNVAPLVNRIRNHCEDPQFTAVVNIESQNSAYGKNLNWQLESSGLVNRIFGAPEDTWRLHVVNLRRVAHDLLPIILSALLELLAFERFRLGQKGSHPTLLVLEEAHHYLRSVGINEEGGQSDLAYERLAKEGRKFGVSLWLSTQRPSELSPTVLAQCGTWIVFRLTSERDLRSVESAGEWFDRQELDRVAGLPRQQAVVFGSGVPLPIRVIAPTADPVPRSKDPDFSDWTGDPSNGPSVIGPQSSGTSQGDDTVFADGDDLSPF